MTITTLLPADEVTVHLSVTSSVDEQLTPAPVFLIDTVTVVLAVDETTTTDSFTYDAAGRMLTRDVNGTETALTWDASSNLTSTTADGVVTVYAYDASGQRVAQATLAAGSEPGTASAYVAGMELTDPDTGSTSTGDVTGTRFYTFGGATVAVRTAQGLSLLLGDEQGSAQIMMPLHTDSNGALLPATQADADNTERTAYAPYGARRGEDLQDINRGWLGQVEDSGTGLTYLNARYYDPAIGRFLSPDPLMDISNPKTLDPYMYAANNPVTFMDATGLCYGLDAKQMAACAQRAGANTVYQRASETIAKASNPLTRGQQLVNAAKRATATVNANVGRALAISQIEFSAARGLAASQESFSDTVTRIGTAGRNGHINFYGGFLNGAISTINGSFAVSPVGIAMSSAGMTNQIPTVGIVGNYDEQRWSSYAGSGSFVAASSMVGGQGVWSNGGRAALTGVRNHGADVAVLGSYPGYIQKGEAIGATYFKLNPTLYSILDKVSVNNVSLATRLNDRFVNQIAAQRLPVLFSNPTSRTGTTFAPQGVGLKREVGLLQDSGYSFVNQWKMQPGGG